MSAVVIAIFTSIIPQSSAKKLIKIVWGKENFAEKH